MPSHRKGIHRAKCFLEAVEGLNEWRFRGEADFEKALLGAEEPGKKRPG